MKTIEHLEELSMLKFTNSEKQKFKDEFDTILEFVSEITKIDLDIDSITSRGLKLDDFRDDKPKKSMKKEDALKNAPKRKDGCFVTPMVIQ